MTEQNESNRIKIFDTTLRDGEQSPGYSMTLDEKLRIAAVLEELRVDIIEAGFPIASQGDFEAVKAVATQTQTATVAALARAGEADIRRAAEALAPAASARIHTFISTSPLHREYKLRKTPEQVIELIESSVSLARQFTDDVEWSPEDGTRTEPDFLCRAVETAVKAGATTINIPDTVGYMVADEYAALIELLLNRVPGLDTCTISTHCHNDLGLAVANSLGGVAAGARQMECTINGIGERAGNAALEELVMAVQTRSDRLPYWTAADSTKIMKASRLLATITGFNVQPNKAIVGANAFAHESGIHQDGMLKNAGTYEIMTPESVGCTHSNLVMGKHSGRHAFRAKLAELGYADLGDNAVESAFVRFKALADHKKEVTDEDLIALVDDTAIRGNETLDVQEVLVKSARHGQVAVSLKVVLDGEEKLLSGEGNGAVDAMFQTLKAAAGMPQTHLQSYSVNAVTGGTDAQAVATVRLEEKGRTVNGQGTDYDTLVASARAYAHALDKLRLKRLRSSPAALSA